MNPPLRWSDFDTYLNARHLGDLPWRVKIKQIVIEETHPRPGVATRVPVTAFEGVRPRLILSPTNQDKLAELFGDLVAGSLGQTVTIRVVPMKVAGQERFPIRIFPPDQSPYLTMAAIHETLDTSEEEEGEESVVTAVVAAPVATSAPAAARQPSEVDEITFDDDPPALLAKQQPEKKPNGHNGQATITEFWRAIKAREMTREEGKTLVGKMGGDFQAALDYLRPPAATA